MTSMRPYLFLLAPIVLLSACASDGPRKPLGVKREPQQRPAEWRPVNALLLRHDANKDGSVSRAEMDEGLKKDFAADDTNRDGVLDAAEVEAINQTRWSADASATSPLIDWNNSGSVDLREYSATVHSVFDDLDADGNGILSAEELKPDRARAGEGGQKRKMRRRD